MASVLQPPGTQASDPSSSTGLHLSGRLGGGCTRMFQGLLRPLLHGAHVPFLLVFLIFYQRGMLCSFSLKSCWTKDEHSLHERDLFLLAQALHPYLSPCGGWCERQSMANTERDCILGMQ